VCPVGNLQLGEDVRDVVAHGPGAQVEACGYLGVAVALGDQVENLAFAGAELGEGLPEEANLGVEKKSMRRLAISGPK
jgi:hypothetical protein